MAEPIPVNPEILKWARNSAGLSVTDVVQKLSRKRITEETVLAWEAGSDSPTYVQLERLAYEVYHRPLALFFFPEVPEEDGVDRSFRTLPDQEIDRIPSRIRYLVRKASVLQLNLAELYGNRTPSTSPLLKSLQFRPTVRPNVMARGVRTGLGITLAAQQGWRDVDEAFSSWRIALERSGVFVFKDSFRAPGRPRGKAAHGLFSGFCLYHDEFPVIYVNNNTPKTRQIFTLFHELAHLLMRTGGVDMRRDDYIESLSGEARLIETLCNRFAAEFLIPVSDLRKRIPKVDLSESGLPSSVSDLARLYGVSREVVLRRLLDLKRVDQATYERFSRRWAGETGKRESGGGDYYRTQGTYLGERYIERVFQRYHQNKISLEETAEYLGAAPKNVPGMEEWLFARGLGA